MSWSDRLRRPGVWQFTDAMAASEAGEAAVRIEELGYSAQWIGEAMGRSAFTNASNLLGATSDLIVATGIANIHFRIAAATKMAGLDLAEQSGGRFVLGIGVSHAPMVEMRGGAYSKPLTTMRNYLAAMDEAFVLEPPGTEAPPVVLAALGPKMLALSAEQASGAHPYWTTPEHTATAREVMGPEALLCVEQKCVLTTDRDVARARSSEQLALYKTLPNYVNNWRRLGFTEAEIEDEDDRLIDALVAWGDEDRIAARVQEHYDAGATHVCLQAVPADGSVGQPDWDLLEALAPGR